MKLLDIIKTANSNLWRNKVRSGLTILAIFVGSFTIILNSAINAGVNDFIDRQIESIGGDGYIEVTPKAVYDELSSLTSGEVQEYNAAAKTIDTSRFDDATLAKLRAVDGVDSLNAYSNLTVDYITSDRTSKKYKLTLSLLPDDSIHIDLLAGRQPDTTSSAHEIVLSEEYLSILGFDSAQAALNQPVTIAIPETLKCMTVTDHTDCQRLATATITGVSANGVMSIGGTTRANPALYEHLVALQQTGLPATQTVARLATGHIDESKIDSIRAAFSDAGFSIVTIDDEVGMIRTFFDAILVVFNIFGAIALIAAAIGIVNTLFMSVQERTREIGLDKALGLTSGKIFLSFSIEAILLGLWGSVAGIAVSMLIGYAANSFFHQPDQFLADLPTFDLVKFSPETILPIVLVIMLIAFIAGTLPARQASRKDPIEALRYE